MNKIYKLASRRNFLKTSSLATAGFWLGSQTSTARAESAIEKLNLGFVGVGGRGWDNLSGLRDQNIVAFCDVDGVRAKKAFEEFPNVPRFDDFRKMLDEFENKIDGVVISTPDHTHFHPCHQALSMGKHVYLEKPLAHSVWETRQLCDLARKKKVATQLGVQRHTLRNMHRSVEIIQAGTIGDVKEVFCWIDGDRGMPAIPREKPPVPSHLNWDLWLGPARTTDYHASIAPYGWRFWWDYGTGETGNWGCHILDIPFWALGLDHPTHVSSSGPEVDARRTPKQLQSTLQFPANENRGAIKLHWDHAKQGPEILRRYNMPHKGFNTLFVGNDGMLLTGFSKYKLYPDEDFVNFKAPEPTIDPSPGFYKEWTNACKGGAAATCNFEYSGPLAETVLLANVAYRSKNQFKWNHNTLETGNEQAQTLIKTPFRSGWEIRERVGS